MQWTERKKEKGLPNIISLVLQLLVCILFFTPEVPAQETATPILKTHSLFTIQSNFSQPSDVVVGKSGKIYILDGVNHQIKVFNEEGDFLFSFGRPGAGNGELNNPLGLGIDSVDRIYVADSGNHRVQIFSSEGSYLSGFSTNLDEKLSKPSDPTDVAVNTTLKRCYVADNDNHRLLIYDLNQGSLIKSCGTMGMDKKDLRYPFLLDIDQNGTIYVVEVINTRVKVLDPDGNYLRNIGNWGVDPGEFYRPKGVAVAQDNRVFVSDSYLGVIQVFDTNGNFLFIVGDNQDKVMKFTTPTGLFIDNNNKLYVVEMFAERVRVLQVVSR